MSPLSIAATTNGLIRQAYSNQYGVARVDFDDDVVVTRTGDLTVTRYPDNGERFSNWPPEDDGSYARVAAELGFGTDLGAYNFEHELCHVLVPRVLFNERGYVSWMAAQRRKMSLAAAKAEERLIYYVQRCVCALDQGATGPVHSDPQITEAARVVLAVRRSIGAVR